MIPLYQDGWFTFRFATARRIPRFHLAGVAAGQAVTIHAADPTTLRPQHILGRAVVGAGGWVDLPDPLIVRPGDVFVVLPAPGG